MLSVSSFLFFGIFIISLCLYYIVPKRVQWMLLLLYSIAFFAASCKPVTIIWLLAGILVTWSASVLISYGKNSGNTKISGLALFFGLAGNFGMLAALKYSSFLFENLNAVLRWGTGADASVSFLHPLTLESPIGISFYTMQAAAYLLDTYWEISEPQKNPFKTALFISYDPQLTSGPITRYSQMKDQLYAGHSFDWKNVTFGLQRMFWGLFKKLVISVRAGVIVDTIYGAPDSYRGLYVWFAASVFMLQLYTDFSGCMDIVIGASECCGIILPENFRTPFFSRSVQEYWQRWHITLGEWLKDYILYPLLRTSLFRNLTKILKKRFGKSASRQIPSYLAMLCVWLLIGMWHGGAWKYILGMGLWFWCCIVLGQSLEPLFKKLIDVLKINTDTFGWHFFQSLRVFILVAVGNMFFRLQNIPAVFTELKNAFIVRNPWILFDDSLYSLGLSAKSFHVLAASVLVLVVVSHLSEKESVRVMIARQNLVFRWIIWITLICSIVVFGVYGPGYNASTFIYQQF